MSSMRRSLLGLHRLFGSQESSSGRRPRAGIGRDSRCRRLRLEPLEDRSLLSVGVGGMVWHDLNADGLRDPAEPGIAAAVAEVFSSADEIIGNADDVSLGVAITDPAGQYSFADLPDSPNFYVVFRTPVDYEFTLQDAGGDDALDSDADAVGKTGLFTIAPDTTATDIDAGLIHFTPMADKMETSSLQLASIDYCYDTATDAFRNQIYIATAEGGVKQYDLMTHTYKDSFAFNYFVRGMAISPDQNTLVGTSVSDQDANCILVKDLRTNVVRTIEFAREPFEGDTYSVAFIDNYTVLVSSGSNSSGNAPLRKVDLNTGNVTVLKTTLKNSMLCASADYSVVAYEESSISSGPFGLYNVSDGTFSGALANSFVFGIAVNRDGSQIAVLTTEGTNIYDRDFNLLTTLGDSYLEMPIGAVYSPNADLLYLSWYDHVDGSSSRIDVYNADTLTQIAVIDSDASFFYWLNTSCASIYGSGRLKISQDGSLLLASLNSGVEVFDLTVPFVAVTAPAYGNAATLTASVSVTQLGSALPDGTAAFLDIDLNNDGDYQDEGETNCLTAALLGGRATFDLAPVLEEGSYRLRSHVTNQAGNEGVSDEVVMIADFTSPNIELSAPSPTNDSTPTWSAVVLDSGSGISEGSRIYLDIDLNNDGDFDDAGEIQYCAPLAHEGVVTSFISPSLADGTYRIRARTSDQAGNEGVSNVLELVIDNTPPDPPGIAATLLTYNRPWIYVSAYDYVGVECVPVPDNTPVFLDVDSNNDGDFDDEGEYEFMTAPAIAGQAVFDLTTLITDGEYLLYLRPRIFDLAGNEAVGDVSPQYVDTVPPDIGLSAPAFTSVVTPTVVVTAITNGAVCLDVDLNDDGDFDDEGETDYMTAMPVDGTATFNVSPALAEGTYNLRARVSDDAGNEGNETATMVVDLTPPSITISAPSASITQGYPVTYTVTYDDLYLNELLLTADDILLVRGGFTETVGGTATVSVLSDNSYLVTIYDITGEGSLCIGIASDTASDMAGNLAPSVLLSEFFDVEYVGPIDLSLSNQEILEHLPAGTAVGAFSTVDTDRNSFTYSLVEGEGDDDNASFTIDGGQLLASETFDYATQSTYAIRVRTTDSHNNSLEKTFTIAIIDTTNFSGLAWNDADGDGLRGADESFLRGIPVELYSSTDDTIGNNDDVLLDAATTDADGRYAFNDLLPGLNYYVVFRAPVGYEFTLQDAGDDDALDSDADATGTSALLSVDAGENYVVVDAGLTGASPDFGWALNAGAADEEAAAEAVVVDDLGNAYIAGYFSGTVDFDPGPGVFNLTSAGDTDVFVAKYSSDGALVWAKSFGGEETDKAFDIALTDDGSLFIAGYFYGTADFDPGAETFALTSAGLNDAFAMKLDADGNLVWAAAMGGEGADLTHAIAVAPDGSVLAAGYSMEAGVSADDPNTDIFVSKLDADGNSVWNKIIGGDGPDEAAGIAADDQGNVFVAGYFSGTVDFDPSEEAYNLNIGEGSRNIQDGFVLKLNPDGDFVWAVGLDGNDVDILNDIAVASDGSVYAVGSATRSIPWIVIPGPFPVQFFPVTIGGPNGGCILGSFGSISSDYPFLDLSGLDTLAASEADLGGPIMFFSTYGATSEANSLDLGARTGGILVKLDSTGNLVWCEETGSSKSETTGLSLGGDGNIYTAGTLENIAYFNNSGNNFALDGADGSGFVSIFNSDGEFVRAFTTGSPKNVSASGLAVAADGAVYVAGLFSNPADFDPGANVFNLENAGDADLFLSKYLAFAGPTDLTISNNSVREGLPAGTSVGDFSTVGELPGAIYKYTLVSGEGDDDNESFVIINGRLQTAAVFDFSEKSSYTVRVRSTDHTGRYVEEEFTVNVVIPHEIHDVVGAEAAASNKNGVLESSDRLLITWALKGAGAAPAVTLLVDDQPVSTIFGPYESQDGGLMFAGAFGPLAAGVHSYTIQSVNDTGDTATHSGTFTVAESADLPGIADVVVAEALKGSDRDGTLEATDKLLITWRETGGGEIASRSLIIDGRAVAAIGGPNAAGCCFALLGSPAEGNHSYTISIVDKGGATYARSGEFAVAAPDAAGPDVADVVVTEAINGSNRNGAMESTDRLLITWRETAPAGIETRSVKIDGREFQLFGGPNAEGCCFAAFGPLEAGSHTYSIELTDLDGVKDIAEGFFDVIAAEA